MNNQRISIIVPVYNVADYLPKCLDTLINQTYKDIEIILVNDGSTDMSGEICSSYADKDSRIRLINQENRGVSAARNAGLIEATGNYIGFIDADDYVHPDMYRILWEKMQQTGVDIVTCSYCFDHEGRIEKVPNLKPVPETPITMCKFLRYVYERDNYRGVANYLVTKLYRRKLIIDGRGGLKIKFNPSLKLAEDILFNAQLYDKDRTILYVNQPLYFYFQRAQSAIHNMKMQLDTLSILRGYEEILEIYENKDVDDQILDLVKRFYVYWCGKYLEMAIEEKNGPVIDELQKIARDHFLSYVKTNMEHLDRVVWLIKLLQFDNTKID